MSKDTKQTNYIVTLTKTFIYPKSMLHPKEPESDAQEKAHFDIYKIIDEYTKNKFEAIESHKLFETEVKEDKGFLIKSNPKFSENKVSIQDVIDTLAQQEFEQKYGLMNVEDNPEIFEFANENWYLREDLNAILDKIRNKFRKLLYKFLKNYNEERPRLRRLDDEPTRNRRITYDSFGNANGIQYTTFDLGSSNTNIGYTSVTGAISSGNSNATATNNSTAIPDGTLRQNEDTSTSRWVTSIDQNYGEWVSNAIWSIYSTSRRGQFRMDLQNKYNSANATLDSLLDNDIVELDEDEQREPEL